MSYLGTFFGMNALGNALQTFQTAADVTSDNIANVNTPGASRQVVNITQAIPVVASPFTPTHLYGTYGEGAVVAQVQRVHEDSYDALFRGASASQNYYSAQQSQLSSLQSSLGEPNNGVNAYFTAFQTAVSQLVDQAGSGAGSAQANVLAAAQSLTQSLNYSAGVIAQQKAQTVQQAGAVVNTVNGILDQIAALNGQIRASTAAGDSPNTASDQRDALIDKLSQYISTQTSVQPDGSALVSVNGQALVNDAQAYHLAPPQAGTNAKGAPALLFTFQGAPATAASSIPLGSGQLAALADLYNNKLTAYGAQLDSFASSLASEVNRTTEAGYDQNGVPGTALFQPIVSAQAISAGNIKVGITNATQLPVGLASTAAGSLITNMNSANNVIDTSSALNGNGALANPPGAAGTSGALTVTVDGVAQSFSYDTAAGDSSIDAFLAHFNGAHLGVSASFDAAGQRIVFARDPANVDAAHRAAQGANPTTADFTIADAPAAGAGLLSALGASGIDGVNQNSSNAFGANDNGGANALLKMFGANVGVPALQTTSGVQAVAAPGSASITLPAGSANVRAGDVLTIDAQPGGGAPQEDVVVTGVSYAGGVETVTANFKNAHAAGFSIASAQTQTLGQYYGQLVTQMGVDTQTATAGAQAQSALSQSIDKARQGVDGINLDEETQNLIKYQNAYQAAARTMNVMDSLLNTVVNSLGVH